MLNMSRLQLWYRIALESAEPQCSSLYHAAIAAARMLLGDYNLAIQHCEQAVSLVDSEQYHLWLTIRLQQSRCLMSLPGKEPEALDVLGMCKSVIPKLKNPALAAIMLQRETNLCDQVLMCRQVCSAVSAAWLRRVLLTGCNFSS